MRSMRRWAARIARFVPAGFLPQSPEERLLIAPPEKNMDVSTWREQDQPEPTAVAEDPISSGNSELEAFRRAALGEAAPS